MQDSPFACQRLRAVFVGDLNGYSKGASRLRAMRALGLEVAAVAHTPRGDADRGVPPCSLAYRIAYRLGRHLDTEDANRHVLDAAERQAPDLVWVEKGTMIRPATLARLRRMSRAPLLLSYSDDDMFLPHNRSRDWVRGLPFYDLVFTTKAANLAADELPALGARRVAMVDKAYDPLWHHPVEPDDADRAAYGAEAGFIGSYERERAEAMLFLARSGVAVRVWGNGWDRFGATHPNLRLERRPLVNVEGDLRFTRAVAATRINLGFLRKLNRDRQTDRSVEIPACGGFLLAERTEDHRRLFAEGSEAAFFDTPDEMLEKVRYYLTHETERRALAAAGRKRCVEGGYSHEARMRAMLAEALGGGAALPSAGGDA